MKFQFLKNLFKSNTKTYTQEEVLEKIPDAEIDGLIDAAVGEKEVESDFFMASSEYDQDVAVEAPQPVLSVKKIAVAFIVKKEMNGSRFELDSINKISRVTWLGNVDLETAMELLTLGADSVELEGYDKLILDRSQLVEFDTEARVWIKGFLKTRAKKIVKKVTKVAMINASTAKGSIFSNFIASAIGMVFPDLEMRKFDTAEDSVNWLLAQ